MTESSVIPFERRVVGEASARDVIAVGCGVVAFETLREPDKGSENEDCLLVLSVDADRTVLAVADGLGGHSGGGAASRIALEQLAQAIRAAVEGDRELRDGILDGFEAGNREILALGTGAATTLVVVEIVSETLRTYHVGDSAVIQIGGRGKLKLQTIMHSPTGYAVESGMLSEKDARVHEERHVVSNIVGSRGMRIDIGPIHPIACRDTVLLASDGLFDNLDPVAIGEILRKGPLPAAMTELVARCRERMKSGGKPDDLTVVTWRRC